MQAVQSVPRPVAETNPPQNIITVQNVTKKFGKNDPTVKDLNFQVREGEIFCLLGPSGSGKSTTMRMLTGVYRPTGGEIRVLGKEPHRFRSKTRSQIGYMPQQFVLFPELSTIENINFVASVYGMNWFGRRQKVHRALEFVDLWDARDTLAGQLSGGMQRRLELASTLVHNPKLIFVDEPTAGIDPILRAKFWDHFKELRDSGRTLFVTTQYVTEADYCDTVAILNQGRLLALGSPEDIRHEAMGGEIINLTVDEVTGPVIRLLRRIPNMRRIQTLSPENLRLTVENASESLQEIITSFRENDINIQSIEPYRPDFEEVFVQLMEQDSRREKAEESAAGQAVAPNPQTTQPLKAVTSFRPVKEEQPEQLREEVPAREQPQEVPPWVSSEQENATRPPLPDTAFAREAAPAPHPVINPPVPSPAPDNGVARPAPVPVKQDDPSSTLAGAPNPPLPVREDNPARTMPGVPNAPEQQVTKPTRAVNPEIHPQSEQEQL